MVDNMMPSRATTVSIIEARDGVKYAYNPFSQPQSVNSEPCNRITINSIEIYCSHCRLSFINQDEYEAHNTEMHGHRKLLSCPQCNRKFRRQDHLKRHMQSLHYNQKYCICPVCKKDFLRQDILLKHIKRKHDTNTEIFHCRECEFECHTHEELEKHERMHVQTDRHICIHCNASFKRRDHMLRHVKSQHLNQSVICPVCNQSYKRRDHVVRHVREKHKMGYINGKLMTAKDLIDSVEITDESNVSNVTVN